MTRSLKSRIALGVALLFGWIASVAFAGAVGVELGGRMGYIDGYTGSSIANKGFAGATSVRAIRAIRSADLEAAVDLLEAQVDDALLAHGYSEGIDADRFRPESMRRCEKTFRNVIGPYRVDFPTQATDPELAGDVMKFARRLVAEGRIESPCGAPNRPAMPTVVADPFMRAVLKRPSDVGCPADRGAAGPANAPADSSAARAPLDGSVAIHAAQTKSVPSR